MALTADYKHAFGTARTYQFVSRISLNRMSGETAVELAVHPSAGDRQRWKVAAANLAAEVAALKNAHKAVKDVENSLKAAGPNDVQAANTELATTRQAAVIAAQAVAVAQAAVDASSPISTYAVTIPAGEIPVAVDGAISLGDVYRHLRAKDIPGSEDA
jgi:hypothetical protein